MFNSIIQSLNLREIALSGRQFTWASRRDNPSYEKLDRILTTVDWEQKFPLVSVRALSRTGSSSDNTPLLIDSGIKAHNGNKSRFSFELFWFKQQVSMRWYQRNGILLIHVVILLSDGKIRLDI
jgi:hypothetical protein